MNENELQQDVIKRYLNLESVFHIQKELGIPQSKVNKILKDNNIEKISQAKRLNPNLIENYFENIDTPEKAYWIGWLITDGCIMHTDYSIQLSLQNSDLHILQQLESDLGVKDKIKIFNRAYYRFYFCSKRMIKDLEKYGLVQNKTLTIQIPEIKEELYPALLRGMFDGDGGISIMNSRNKWEYELSFTGNEKCVTQVNNLISKLTGLKERTITPNHSIYRIRWSNPKEIIEICDILYKNSNVHHLNRKYEKYLQIKENTEVN